MISKGKKIVIFIKQARQKLRPKTSGNVVTKYRVFNIFENDFMPINNFIRYVKYCLREKKKKAETSLDKIRI
jgi:hypothetical protein